MPKFRKKPVVVEAVQLCWRNWGQVCNLLGDIISEQNPGRLSDSFVDDCGEKRPYIELTIPTLEGDHIARHGDYIIRGVNGEFYPCKPDIFAKTYERACNTCDGTGGVWNVPSGELRQCPVCLGGGAVNEASGEPVTVTLTGDQFRETALGTAIAPLVNAR